jgi:hypothetical protein
MATKQIKITLQSQPHLVGDVTVRVDIDSVICFNQTVPPAGPITMNSPDPLESFTFDLDVPALANTAIDTQTRTFAITATNGIAKIRNIFCNFTAVGNTTGNVTTFVPGTADNFVMCRISSQPLWNGQALLDRYNIAETPGAGEVYIADGETVVFDVPVWLFNSSAP